LKMTAELWPPKPNELERTVRATPRAGGGGGGAGPAF